jgi:hypothetical protein
MVRTGAPVRRAQSFPWPTRRCVRPRRAGFKRQARGSRPRQPNELRNGPWKRSAVATKGATLSSRRDSTDRGAFLEEAVSFYSPKSYLTLAVLSEIVAERQWPAPYTLEDDLPDGILMRFPACTLYICEGFEGNMDIRFLTEETKTDPMLGNLRLGHALLGLIPESERDHTKPLTPNLIGDTSPSASLGKVQNGIRDLCIIVLTHLQPCLLGDFGWVRAYQTGSGRAPGA